MDFEEIKERYRMIPLWGRFLIMGIIGLLPGGYVYWDEGEALQIQLDEASAAEVDARTKFEDSRKQKANLPKMEEDMLFTEEQLRKAKQKLPDDYRIEEVLQKAATVAKEVGVKLVGFDPGEETKHFQNYNYVEMPIKTEIVGRFSQVAAFYDRIVHLENSIFVRNIEMKPAAKKASATGTDGQPIQQEQQKTDFQLARENRQNLRLSATFDLAIFRSMSDAEAIAPKEGEEGDGRPTKGDAPPNDVPTEGAPEPEKATETARAAGPEDVTTF